MTYNKTDFSKNLNKFKKDLKLFGIYIRAVRKDHKIAQRGAERGGELHFVKEFNAKHDNWKPDISYPLDPFTCKYHARHMHVAYSLLRGRTMSEIEPKIADDNNPSMRLVDKYVEKYMGIENFVENLESFRRDKPIVKMYVLVREDLDPVHQMVQGGHAVAQYLLEHGTKHNWNNGYMIYLAVKDEKELIEWEKKIHAVDTKFATFTETDWGEPTKTAIACIDFGLIFSKLRLMTFKKEKKNPEMMCV